MNQAWVHTAISNVWTRLRSASPTPSAEEVLKVEEIVRKRFGHWFNKVHDGSKVAAEQISAAEAAAINEVNALLAAMR